MKRLGWLLLATAILGGCVGQAGRVPEGRLGEAITQFASEGGNEAIPQWSLEYQENLKRVLGGEEVAEARLVELMADLKTKVYADAPELRTAYINYIQTCTALSLSLKQPEKILERCGYPDVYPEPVDWHGPHGVEFGLSETDDITASAQTLPYLVIAEHYWQRGDRERAKYYYEQIINHEWSMQEWNPGYVDSVPLSYLLIKQLADERLVELRG